MRKRTAVPKFSIQINIPIISGHRKEWEEHAWNSLLSYLHKLTSAELKSFIQIVASPRERHDILMRATAIDRLQKDAAYRTIGKELWLTPQTVSAIKRALIEGQFKSYKERSKSERKKRPATTWRPTKSGKRDPMLRRIKTKYGTIYSRL